MRRRLPLAAVVVLLASEAPAQTLFDRGPPENRLIYRSLVALRVNPLGLIFDGRLGYRRRLHASDSLALRDNYVGGGLQLTLTPADTRVGPYLEIAPASFLTLWGAVLFDAYFGTFGLAQSFPSADADFSPDEISRRADLPDGDPLAPYSTTGFEAHLGADLQFKVRSLLVRSRARLVYVDLDLRAGDHVYYDQFYDLLIGDQGWMATNDLDVAYIGMGNRLVAGLRYTASAPFYGEEHGDGDNGSHRLGPLLSYTFKIRDGARFNAPGVFVLVQWWLDHRYRAGQEVSRGLPLIGAGFQFYGDLLAFD
jgi:hypothetical protein